MAGRNAARGLTTAGARELRLEAWLETREPLRDLEAALRDLIRARVSRAGSPAALERVVRRTVEAYVLAARPDGPQDAATCARSLLRERCAHEVELGSGAASSREAPTPEEFGRGGEPELVPTEGALRAAYEASVDQLSRALEREFGSDIARVLAPPDEPRPSRVYPGPELTLCVDHTAFACARYLAGLQVVRSDTYGFDELVTPRAGGTRPGGVTVKFDADPDDRSGHDGSFVPRPSERKAKTFVLLVALAAECLQAGGDPSDFEIGFRDLLRPLGIAAGSRTNGPYTWRYAAEVAQHLLVDLPNRVVALEVMQPGASDPLVVFERLLVRSAFDVPPEDDAALRNAAWSAARTGHTAVLAERLRAVRPASVRLGVSAEFLRALGMTPPLHAFERVPVDVLRVRGPAFWLAWQLSFLRRWAPPPRGGGNGKVLSRVLAEAGYAERFRRDGRMRVKDALRAWWADVGTFVAFGLLDEPGVRLFRASGGGWRDVSTDVSRALDTRGRRLTEAELRELRVIFAVPRRRVEQLRDARMRRRGRS